jgi:exodeoxyribonuclease-3
VTHFAVLEEAGWTDVMAHLHPDETHDTWWDDLQGSFRRGWGMRIDLAFASPPLLERVVATYVDRETRKGETPSDHAAVVVEFSDRP